jgi:hypothetical protein
MERRSALKSMAITAWGLMFLPACGPDGKELAAGKVKTLSLDKLQHENLKSLVDTLLPKTETLGAVELNVHTFIDRILANCYELEEQQKFIGSLDLVEKKTRETHKMSFAEADKSVREQILTGFDQEELVAEKDFFDQLKELTLLGYTTSEYFLTNFTNYELIPGGYDGCVPVPNEPFKIQPWPI